MKLDTCRKHEEETQGQEESQYSQLRQRDFYPNSSLRLGMFNEGLRIAVLLNTRWKNATPSDLPLLTNSAVTTTRKSKSRCTEGADVILRREIQLIHQDYVRSDQQSTGPESRLQRSARREPLQPRSRTKQSRAETSLWTFCTRAVVRCGRETRALRASRPLCMCSGGSFEKMSHFFKRGQLNSENPIKTTGRVWNPSVLYLRTFVI